MTTLPAVDVGRTLDDAETARTVQQIADDGYAIVEDVLAPDFIREIREELDHLEAERPGGDIPPGPFTGFHTRRWFDVLNDGEVWQRVATHPALLPVLEAVLGPTFLLSTMGSAVIGPGEEAQPIHCDDQLYLMDRPHKNLVCNTMWALSDFTEENGATRVVPGSNHLDRYPDRAAAYETVPVEMPMGSVAFVVGTCYHGAGANRSDDIRWGLTINYCSGAVRQQENYMLAIPPERMMTFPPQLQDLLGFKAYVGGCGHIFAGDARWEMEQRYRADPAVPRAAGRRSQRFQQ